VAVTVGAEAASMAEWVVVAASAGEWVAVSVAAGLGDRDSVGSAAFVVVGFVVVVFEADSSALIEASSFPAIVFS